MTCPDAVEIFGAPMNDESLEDAYRRAGPAFKNQMEPNFGILKDEKIMTRDQ